VHAGRATEFRTTVVEGRLGRRPCGTDRGCCRSHCVVTRTTMRRGWPQDSRTRAADTGSRARDRGALRLGGLLQSKPVAGLSSLRLFWTRANTGQHLSPNGNFVAHSPVRFSGQVFRRLFREMRRAVTNYNRLEQRTKGPVAVDHSVSLPYRWTSNRFFHYSFSSRPEVTK